MTPSAQRSLDDDAVAEFLAANTDFFARRPELLPDLDVPLTVADGATVVSLAERQVAVLRQRNAALRKRMATLLANAKENERTFAAMRAFTVALMDAANADEASRAIGRHLVGALDVDHAACLLQGEAAGGDQPHLLGVAGEPPLAGLFAHTKPACSTLRPAEYGRLFGEAPEGPGSVAVVPLAIPKGAGALALGAKDPERFTPGMGKLFLGYVGDVLSHTLRRLRPLQ